MSCAELSSEHRDACVWPQTIRHRIFYRWPREQIDLSPRPVCAGYFTLKRRRDGPKREKIERKKKRKITGTTRRRCGSNIIYTHTHTHLPLLIYSVESSWTSASSRLSCPNNPNGTRRPDGTNKHNIRINNVS